MKVIFFLEYYHPNIGGVETLFKALVDSLAKEQHDITVITSRPYPHCPLYVNENNVTLIRIPVRSRYIFTFLGFFYLIRYISRGDLIHTTSYNAAIPAFFVAKLFRKKVIVTFHEVWDQLWFQLPYMNSIGRWGHYLFEQFLLKLPFDKFIGVSKSTSTNLIKAGVAKHRVTTIYNGINYTEFNATSKTDENEKELFYFTYFGRLGISKGLDILLPATEILSQQYENIRLQLIIPKVPASFLEQIYRTINSSSLKEKTIILHELPFKELKRKLITSDCVVIPSYSEGFCFAAAECVAMQVPLISSNRAALKEVVSGKFINMEDFSKDGLVKSMRKAYNGKWQYTPIKRFELKDTIKNYQEVYAALK